MTTTAADLELNGAQLKDLQGALMSAFPSRFAFEQLAQFKFEVNLNEIVKEAGSLEQVAFEVIGWAKSNGKLAWLIASARAENSGNPDLKAFADELSIQPLAPIEAPSAAAANRGLTALHELMDLGDARDAVRAFEAEFRTAVEQIDVLSLLKEVHDLLHTLQFRCYDGLARQVARFPADDLAREIISEHGTTLEETIAQLDAVTAHPSFEGKPRWIADLIDARARVSAALEESNVEPLKVAVALLDRVLAIQPTRINTRLNDSARTLRLRDLVENLRHIHTELSAAALDPAKVAEFATGIVSLEQLDLALRQLVTEHDRWQELDVELRLERNALLISADGLKSSWPRLETLLLPLCGGGEPWSIKLTDECKQLSAALAAIDVAAQRNAFLQVHSQAATRFYQVDISLHRLCESLREIGNPLTELLRRLQ